MVAGIKSESPAGLNRNSHPSSRTEEFMQRDGIVGGPKSLNE
jgi:hypothetical protein